ncbi:MAG TPA: peptidoglycan-binding domain-containing protein [Solirubrobacteraceae bacterium]|nr:peptidoglycan-binding domain-containing protein [Solirubrobacteraceae bacterium]
MLAAVLAAPTVQAMKFGQRTIRPGMKGADVVTLQQNLGRLGFNIPADGQYGPQTVGAVKSFQKTEGLAVNGLLTRHDAIVMRKVIVANAAQLTGGAEANPALPPPVQPAQPPANPNPNPPAAAPGDNAQLTSDGMAVAPASAPQAVKDIITAGNKIAKLPYRYGGGHNVSFQDTAYDCSGSVSFALHGANLLDSPLPSGDLESWGQAGKGSWVTVYANAGHAFMTVAGLRYDTSGRTDGGSRWQSDMRDTSAYVARHPANL